MLAEGARLRDGSLLAAPGAMADLRAHAIDAHPQECIGLLDASGRYRRLENTSDRPEAFAVVDKRLLAREMAAGNLRALCHSHPGGPDCPSEEDGRAQIETEVPFIIVATNGQATAAPFAFGDQLLDDAPLVGRPFRHYAQDCYAMIRAHRWREFGEVLPDYPRNWEWWLTATPGEKDLYRRYFADAGYREVDRSAARAGDVFLAAVRSDVPNHAGVYLDAGLALHHPSSGLPYDPARLSKREPIARWSPMITHWLRRE